MKFEQRFKRVSESGFCNNWVVRYSICMYIPAHNVVTEEAPLWDVMREFNFAMLITAPDGIPFATSIPFTPLEKTRKLTAHVARANPQWQHLETAKEVLVVFQAEHALISSRWYEKHPNVPTWNYATVHVYGKPRLLNADETRAQLIALMDHHGHGADMNTLSEKYLAGMQNELVGFEIDITRIEGKFKLSQNRSKQDQQNVIAKLEEQGELERGIAERMKVLQS
jgi:transcriptional regulator